jgi:hypothetical protein
VASNQTSEKPSPLKQLNSNSKVVSTDKKNINDKSNKGKAEAQKPLGEPNSPKKQNSITKKNIGMLNETGLKGSSQGFNDFSLSLNSR